jgi:hypothetical protein
MHKFKIGEKVSISGQPFEYLEIIEQLPSHVEHQYRVGRPPIPSVSDLPIVSAAVVERVLAERSLVRVNDVVDELLALAEVERRAATTTDILLSLCVARDERNQILKKPPLKILLDNLRNRIEELGDCFAELKRYDVPSDIAHPVHRIGDRVVDVLPAGVVLDASNDFQATSLTPIIGTARINIQRLLRSLYERVTDVPVTQHGGQPKPDKRMIVARAASFFRRYSTAEFTTYPSGAFPSFCRRFYEIVTGDTHLDLEALQTQIKEEGKQPTFGI